MRLDFHLEGVTQMEAGLMRAERAGEDAFQAAMFMFWQDIMDACVPKVPFRDGDLLESRYILRSWPIDGGFTAEHAAPVHEVPATHRRGEWKYLQKAMSEASAGAEGQLQRYWEQALARGTTLTNAPARHPDQMTSGSRRPTRERPRTARRRRPVARKRR